VKGFDALDIDTSESPGCCSIGQIRLLLQKLFVQLCVLSEIMYEIIRFRSWTGLDRSWPQRTRKLLDLRELAAAVAVDAKLMAWKTRFEPLERQANGVQLSPANKMHIHTLITLF
jgi:hypothetical protein